MLGDAASDDVEVVKTSTSSSKNEVVFPIGIPDTGYFDFVDSFTKDHPDYVELSDRKLLEWAQKSGVRGAGGGGTNDKPDLKLGVHTLEVSKPLLQIAASLNRNYIIPELRANLLQGERKQHLTNFSSSKFRKKALVVMGEPDDKYKASVRQRILDAKRQKAISDKKRKRMEAEI